MMLKVQGFRVQRSRSRIKVKLFGGTWSSAGGTRCRIWFQKGLRVLDDGFRV